MRETFELLLEISWSDNPLAGKVVIVTILLLLGRAVFVALRQLARYRRERQDLDRVAVALEEWRVATGSAEADVVSEEGAERPGDASDTASGENENESVEPDGEGEDEPSEAFPVPSDVRHPALIPPDRLLEVIRPDSLIGERIRAIAKMRSYRVKIDIETLQQLAARRDEATPGQGFPTFAAGLAMLLGILGTFAGLAIMVQQIDLGLPRDVEAIDIDLWASSIEHLRTVLGGMKTAFSTSLIGMVTAVLLSSLDHRIRGARRRTFERLERLTAEELLPATVPAVEDELLLEAVSYRLEESFQRLDEIWQQNRKTLRDLNAIQGAFVEIVDEVRQITRAQAARNLDALIAQIERANENVAGVAAQIPRIARSIEGMSERAARALEERSWRPPEPSRILGLRPLGWVYLLSAIVAVLALLRMMG